MCERVFPPDTNPEGLKPPSFHLHPPRHLVCHRTKGTEMVGQQNPTFTQIKHTAAQESLCVRRSLASRAGGLCGIAHTAEPCFSPHYRALLYVVDLAGFRQLQHTQPHLLWIQTRGLSVLSVLRNPLIRLLGMRGRAGWAGSFLWPGAFWAGITHSQCKPVRKGWIRAQVCRGAASEALMGWV